MTTTRALISDAINDDEDQALFLGSDEGEFDAAIIGISLRGGTHVIVYDIELVIDVLVTTMEMTVEDAWDWFYYNIDRAYMGPGTPIYMTSVKTLRDQH